MVSVPYSTFARYLSAGTKKNFSKNRVGSTAHKSNVSGFPRYCFERRDPSPHTVRKRTFVTNTYWKKRHVVVKTRETQTSTCIINIGRIKHTGGEGKTGEWYFAGIDLATKYLPRQRKYFFPFFLSSLLPSIDHRIDTEEGRRIVSLRSHCAHTGRCAYGAFISVATTPSPFRLEISL